jgi:hypothetical protein
MSYKKKFSPPQPQSDQDEQSRIAYELALLEGQHQIALDRRRLILQGAAPVRRFSRNGLSEAELTHEAIAEIDAYLVTLDAAITQKRLALEIVTCL